MLCNISLHNKIAKWYGTSLPHSHLQLLRAGMPQPSVGAIFNWFKIHQSMQSHLHPLQKSKPSMHGRARWVVTLWRSSLTLLVGGYLCMNQLYWGEYARLVWASVLMLSLLITVCTPLPGTIDKGHSNCNGNFGAVLRICSYIFKHSFTQKLTINIYKKLSAMFLQTTQIIMPYSAGCDI